MLTKRHSEDVCLIYGGHKSCRYSVYDQQTGKYLCCKKVPGLKEEIDKRIEEFISKAKKNQQDLGLLGRPIADNCQGYFYLKNTQQGHDVPGSA